MEVGDELIGPCFLRHHLFLKSTRFVVDDMNPKDTYMNLDLSKKSEKEQFNIDYAKLSTEAMPVNIQSFINNFEVNFITPFWRNGKSIYAGGRRMILNQLPKELKGLKILDYACGRGYLGIYLAIEGALVNGFDISQEAIKIAKALSERYNIAHLVKFDVLDAEKLNYQNEEFDIVIGTGALHHVIKYPKSSTELYRVLKPKGKAIFHENFGENPPMNWVRKKFTIKEDLGDTLLTTNDIEQFSTKFSKIEIIPFNLFYMVKRIIVEVSYKSRLLFLWIAFTAKIVDRFILFVFPKIRKYCGECMIVLTK